jgi:hypothetical protein
MSGSSGRGDLLLGRNEGAQDLEQLVLGVGEQVVPEGDSGSECATGSVVANRLGEIRLT